MRPPFRIAVLECDTPLDNANSKYEGYGGVFKNLLKASAVALGGINPETDLIISKYNIVERTEYPSLEGVDAILLTGSKHDSFADEPWILTLVEFTKKAYAHDRVRLIGVCFGHQIIGRALGAPVGRSHLGWEISVCDMDLTEKGKELFGKEKLSIQQMHRDIVSAYPKEVVPLGFSPKCDVQGMYMARKLITVQGHPEFDSEIMSEILDKRKQLGIFSEEAYKEAFSRATNPHDGVAVGAAFLRFLLEE